MSADAREELATRQAELLAALMDRAPPPEGFDTVGVLATAASLITKRIESVRRCWPAFADEIGTRFEELFHSYAAQTPLPATGGPLADGRAFADWLATRNQLPEACRLQALAVDLRYARSSAGLVPRRGPAVRLAWLPQRRHLVLGLRLPLLGERWCSIPLFTR